jgi:hypothetical protein
MSNDSVDAAIHQREDFDGENRCREAISSFLHAEEVLWYAEHARPCRCLTSFRENLLAACAALRDANRLRAWEDINHDALYHEYCQRNVRTTPLATYQGARNLFDAACRGELAESTLIEAWDRESMRGVFRWLRFFVAELSGQGAFLNRQRQLVLPATPPTAISSPLTRLDPTTPTPTQQEATVKKSTGSGRGRKEPSEEAFKVYRYRLLTGKTQTDMANDPELMELLNRKVDQGTISRWLSCVRDWLEAGNVLPDLSASLSAKPVPIDPERLDMGERIDGRATRQRGRRTSDRDD